MAELRHRIPQAREGQGGQPKATGLGNFPCEAVAEDKAWAEVAMAAVDLVCWPKLICVADEPATARSGTGPFGYAILQIAGEVTARQACLHLDRTWAWAKAVEKASCRLRFCAPKQFGGYSYKLN